MSYTTKPKKMECKLTVPTEHKESGSPYPYTRTFTPPKIYLDVIGLSTTIVVEGTPLNFLYIINSYIIVFVNYPYPRSKFGTLLICLILPSWTRDTVIPKMFITGVKPTASKYGRAAPVRRVMATEVTGLQRLKVLPVLSD